MKKIRLTIRPEHFKTLEKNRKVLFKAGEQEIELTLHHHFHLHVVILSDEEMAQHIQKGQKPEDYN